MKAPASAQVIVSIWRGRVSSCGRGGEGFEVPELPRVSSLEFGLKKRTKQKKPKNNFKASGSPKTCQNDWKVFLFLDKDVCFIHLKHSRNKWEVTQLIYGDGGIMEFSRIASCLWVVFWHRLSCTVRWSSICCTAEKDLEFLTLLLPSPKCWDNRCMSPCWAPP